MKKLDHKFGSIVLEDGILIFNYNVQHIDLAIAKEAVKERIQFSEGVAYPCLFDVSGVKNTDKEARDYMANDGNELVTASALIVISPMLKMAANFFITVNKPKNPTKLFTSKKEAKDWLEQFK